MALARAAATVSLAQSEKHTHMRAHTYTHNWLRLHHATLAVIQTISREHDVLGWEQVCVNFCVFIHDRDIHALSARARSPVTICIIAIGCFRTLTPAVSDRLEVAQHT